MTERCYQEKLMERSPKGYALVISARFPAYSGPKWYRYKGGFYYFI